MLIIGSYHKTGSVLFSKIWKDYLNENKKLIKDFNHFDEVNDTVIKNTKCVVLIRCPMEIIISGVRYHQITNENWCVNIKKYNNVSYQQHLKSLNDDDKIIFEMENCAFQTINAIYNDMKNRNFNNNVLFIKLEDLYDQKNISFICDQIKNHCGPSFKIKSKKLCQSFIKCLKTSYHRTNDNNNYTYNEHFTEQHINHFNNLFPKDLLDVMGYTYHTFEDLKLSKNEK